MVTFEQYFEDLTADHFLSAVSLPVIHLFFILPLFLLSQTCIDISVNTARVYRYRIYDDDVMGPGPASTPPASVANGDAASPAASLASQPPSDSKSNNSNSNNNAVTAGSGASSLASPGGPAANKENDVTYHVEKAGNKQFEEELPMEYLVEAEIHDEIIKSTTGNHQEKR